MRNNITIPITKMKDQIKDPGSLQKFHTELVESGKELPQLREFFSNPGNFEQHVSRASEVSTMYRTPSVATLDSLDTTRYSEEGGGDRVGSGADVAVLEFELRKARETINALRVNLTQVTDTDTGLDKSSKDNFNQASLKPHEKRALNFLINEYLLLQDYKLTSITFSDENPEQEFEDWDDVGLNIPRPPGLISLFRGSTSVVHASCCDVSTQFDSDYFSDAECQTENDEANVCANCHMSMQNEASWVHELHIQAEEINLLKQKIIALETEKMNFQKLYDAAIISLNTLTSPASDKQSLELHMSNEKLNTAQERFEQQINQKPITYMATENHYGSSNSTQSATPEQFELIENDKHCAVVKKGGSNTSSFEPGVDSSRGSPLRPGSITTLEDTLSINDATEWTRLQLEYNVVENSKEMWIDSVIPNNLKESIMRWCNEGMDVSGQISNDLLLELVNSEKPVTLPGLLLLVADTLPRILPHTLLARRNESAALLSAAVVLLPPADSRRAKLLHTLLTLYKKPDPPDAKILCEAACLIVKWGGSGEVLSSIAELLASKSPERRILASQICLAVAPYVPLELCTSLLLSLVVLMCESSESELRYFGLKSAVLICPIVEHKYGQLENILFHFLKDPVDRIVKDAVNVFLPVLARSALISGKFLSMLCNRIISNLVKASSENDWKNVVLYLDVLRTLVIAKLSYVINVQIVRDVTLSNCDLGMIQYVMLSEQECFVELQCYLSDNCDGKTLLVAMNSLLKEKPDVRWPELMWFIKLTKQILEVMTTHEILNHSSIYELVITLFSSYVYNFGVHFTCEILKPLFQPVISDLEYKLEKLQSVNENCLVVVGIYLVTILAIEEADQQIEYLQKWLMYGSIRSLPIKMLVIPLKWLTTHRPDLLELYLQHMREFVASSCDVVSGSALRVYTAKLVAELLSVAECSDETIERHLLPAVTALLHDDETSVREVAITAWGSVTRTCLVRGLATQANNIEPLCWPPFEELLNSRTLSNKESVKAAEALTLLVLPTVESHSVSERAVSLLCALCHRSPQSAESVAALSPGLQLATHHCSHHPALLPALRKLEEAIQTASLLQFKPAIESLLHVVSNETPRVPSPKPTTNLQTAQEVGRRVTQMFQHSKTNINLPNIFKKKT
ncbi:RAB11-binding protein RELCH homolog isoform X2 [Leptidea sinapis]|uniref:RAB11-binding protein RELCH homolog isoform X2 n=1 Tax=Leptidea sinapis TaxID=189913 RepID=UPI0021C2AD2F|nr:RAB11-binding protein RELCH homolog isoform X2 [Leptidea sinapis]